jgi:hypothetical protein
MTAGEHQLALLFTHLILWLHPIAKLTKIEWTAQTSAMINKTHYFSILIRLSQFIIAFIGKMSKLNNITTWPNMVRKLMGLFL